MPGPPSARIRIPFGARAAAVGVTVLAVCNVLLTGTTYFYLHASEAGSVPGGPIVSKLLRHGNLGNENVLASWYSSMLILACALLAWLCFAADAPDGSSAGHSPARERWLARGWILVALMFALLSLDEVGSLHERIGATPRFNLVSGVEVGWVYILAVPIALTAAGLLSFAWLRLRRETWVCLLFVAGIMLYLAVPALEQLQNRTYEATGWGDDLQPSVGNTVVEESTEVLATLCFFAAMTLYAAKRTKRPDGGGGALTFAAPGAFALAAVLALGDLAMRASEIAARELTSGDKGIPNNWFPSALAALAAGGALALWSDGREDSSRSTAPYLLAAPYALILSAYYGAHWRGWLNTLRSAGADVITTVNGVLIGAAILLALVLAWRARGLAVRALALAFPLLLALAFSGWQRRGDAGWVDYWACAALFATMLGHLVERARARETMPQGQGLAPRAATAAAAVR